MRNSCKVHSESGPWARLRYVIGMALYPPLGGEGEPSRYSYLPHSALLQQNLWFIYTIRKLYIWLPQLYTLIIYLPKMNALRGALL